MTTTYVLHDAALTLTFTFPFLRETFRLCAKEDCIKILREQLTLVQPSLFSVTRFSKVWWLLAPYDFEK